MERSSKAMWETAPETPTAGAYRRFRVWGRVGLQARMTLSYVWVTVVSLLLLTGLAMTLLAIVITGGVLPQEANDALKPLVVQQAQVYALEASLQAGGSALNPQTTFQPGQPETLLPPHGSDALTIPYVNPGAGGASQSAFALLIAPPAEIMASSAPGQYRLTATASALLPQRLPVVTNALAGRAGSGVNTLTTLEGVTYAVEPVWSQEHTTLG